MKKALLGLAVVSAVTYAAWNLRGSSSTTGEPDTLAENVVLDRLWIDHMPRNDRDIIQVFVAITEQPFGIFQATSQWKGNFELFQYEASGGEIRIVYGQTGEREKVKARGTKCSEKGMDYCLQLDGATRGVKKYYSMEGWEIDHVATVDEIRTRVQALVESQQ
ncbi:MAG: hypothetical protein ABI867_39520 [Kofleriaceae bacterium]